MAIERRSLRYDWVLDFDINCFSVDWRSRSIGRRRRSRLRPARQRQSHPGAKFDQLPALRRVEDVVMNCVKD